MELPQSIAQLVVERARAEGVSPEELLLDIFARVDPPARAREYVRATRGARGRGLRGVGQGAISGRRLRRLGAPQHWPSRPTRIGGRRLGLLVMGSCGSARRSLLASWGVGPRRVGPGNAMHVNFYEGWMDRASVEKALERARRPVKEVAELVGGA